ncbi:MAG: exonuclease SbcCD subunit D [Anaerolineales bacterium]|nr:exonuclease SbcCD subunit D [Anaerolineales bacterium]
MIKLLHFADLHLGMENYGRIDPETGLSTRLTDFLRSYDQVVDYALDNDVSLVVFSGDAYKTRDPNPTYQREFARRIRRLSTAGIPTVLVAGNHDTPSAVGRAITVEIFATLEVENVYVAKRPEVIAIETKDGPVQVVALPWVTRSALLARDEYKNKNLEEINQLILDRITNIVEGPDGLISQLDRAVPTILAAHATVQGAVYGSERSVMLGQEVILPPSLARNPAFDYVALGHIHKHQVLNEQPPVIYSGSIERIDFGEEREDKGFVVAEVERGQATWQFVKTDARPFVTIEVDVQGDDPTADILEAIATRNIENAVVRIIIHTTAEKEPLINEGEIRRALAGAFHIAAIVKDVERKVRLRLGDQPIEEMTPRQMLERYFQVKQTSPERTELLLEHAEDIFRELEER